MSDGLQGYFTKLLMLSHPWRVTEVKLSDDLTRTDIFVNTGRVKKVRCPECGELHPIYDRVRRTWKHTNMCQSESYVTADVPRVNCPKCGIRRIDVPWAESYVGYTKAFEELALIRLRKTPISVVCKELNVSYPVLHGIMERYVSKRLESLDLSNLRRISLDETSSKRGHRYISVITDADNGRIVFIGKGKGSEVLLEFTDWLRKHNGKPENIELISCDFSKSFMGGISKYLPNSDVVYDRFHLCKMVNDALDKVRSVNQINGRRYKFIRFKLLRNGKDLSDYEKDIVFDITHDNVVVGLAYEMKESLIQVYDYPDKISAGMHLSKWVDWVLDKGHDRMKAVARTVRYHVEKILNWYDCKMSNGFIEGLNGMIQCTKRVGRGYPNTDNFINVIWFKHGRLDLV